MTLRIIVLLALLGACLFIGCGHDEGIGCSRKGLQNAMTGTMFTDSDGCKALLRDVLAEDSPFRDALEAGRFTVERHSGDRIVETDQGQLAFNLKEKKFRIVRGIDPKTGAPHKIMGSFVVSKDGELKARFD